MLDVLAQHWQFFLGTGIVGSLVGYGAKHLLDERSAHLAGKRRFTEKVTDHISELAGDYYWLLANHASVVAGQLEEYLQLRTTYLLLQWPDHEELERHLEDLAGETADASFVNFARVVSLFRDFQFERGSTFLLTEHWAGETIKKLYNRFIEAAGRIDKDGHIMRALVEASLAGGDGDRARSWQVFASEMRENKALEETKQAYRDWLFKGSDEIGRAADALRACSELLNRQLAQLYADWYGGKIDEGLPRLGILRATFSPDARRVIERTRFEAALLQPVRESYAAAPSTSRPPERTDELVDEAPAGVEPAGAPNVPPPTMAPERREHPQLQAKLRSGGTP